MEVAACLLDHGAYMDQGQIDIGLVVGLQGISPTSVGAVVEEGGQPCHA